MSLKISVIICAYNRANFLIKGLNALVNQTEEKKNYEVIIVDNNSTDSTKEICEKIISENPDCNLKYCVEKQQGLSFARNRGIQEAKADLVSYIDDDGIAREDYVRNLILSFDKYPKYGAIGGKVIPIYESGKEPVWMNKYIQGVVSKVDYGDKIKPFSKKYPAGCNMAFRKHLFADFGAFNTNLVFRGDDKFVFHNLKSHDVKILYNPNVFVSHFIDSYRTKPEVINKISKTIGASERLRLQDKGFMKNLSKLIEYIFKFFASIALLMLYTIKGQYPKGHYSVKVMFYTILGYFQAKKSARL